MQINNINLEQFEPSKPHSPFVKPLYSFSIIPNTNSHCPVNIIILSFAIFFSIGPKSFIFSTILPYPHSLPKPPTTQTLSFILPPPRPIADSLQQSRLESFCFRRKFQILLSCFWPNQPEPLLGFYIRCIPNSLTFSMLLSFFKISSMPRSIWIY